VWNARGRDIEASRQIVHTEDGKGKGKVGIGSGASYTASQWKNESNVKSSSQTGNEVRKKVEIRGQAAQLSAGCRYESPPAPPKAIDACRCKNSKGVGGD